jgi:hypothetical protein
VRETYRRGIYVFSVLAIAVGAALLVQTARHGGGTFGYVLGALFIALGAGRLTILRKTR